MTQWLDEWVRSPGFGGLAAVVAALIALAGVRRSAAVQRETARKDRWWERLRWAVDLTLSPETSKSATGLRALEAIADTAPDLDEEEADFVASIADLFFPARASGTLEGQPTADEEGPA